MAHGRLNADWQRTSMVLAQQYNMNRDPKSSTIEPDRFNPYAEKRQPLRDGDKVSMSSLRDTFKDLKKGPRRFPRKPLAEDGVNQGERDSGK